MHRRSARFAPLAVIVMMTLAACGDDDDAASAVSDDGAVAAPAADRQPISGATECPPEGGSEERVVSFEQAPPMCIDQDATYTAEVETNKGSFTITLDARQAPLTVNNFVVLARYHFYDGVPCHRIIPTFMAQCGDPTGTGRGGPGYEFADELPEAGAYVHGAVAMANHGPDTNGSQFFVVTAEGGSGLAPDYSLFGMVTEGLDSTVADIAAAGNPDPQANGVPPQEEITIERVTITES